MKSRNRVLLSCIVASLVTSGGCAISEYTGCSPSTVITVSDANTTGVELRCYDQLNITSTGSVKVSISPYRAVDSTSYGYITNWGLITAETNSSDGYIVGIEQYNVGNTIKNYGYIDVKSSADASSVGIGQVFDSTILQDGTFTNVEVTSSSGVYKGVIINSNHIEVNSLGGTAAGIVEVNGVVQNDGVIEANSTSAGAVGIWSVRGPILNFNKIIANGSNYSVGLDAWDGNITNAGNIAVTSTNEYAFGIFQMSKAGTDTNITNLGTITATSDNGQAVGISQNINDGVNAAIENGSTGTIKADIAFAIPDSSEGFSSLIINKGTVDTSMISAPGSVFTNSGMIKLHGNRVSRVRSFTQASTGTLSLDADFVSSDGSTIIHPTIYAEDSVSIADGSKIYVNVIGGYELEQAMLDQNATIDGIVVSGGSMSVNPQNLVVDDNSSTLDFEAYMNAEYSLGLKLIEDQGAGSEVPTPVVTPQERPEIVVATPTLGAETLNVLNTIVQKREYSASGLGGGDMAFVDKHFWLKPFGVYTKQNDKDGKNGFDANTYGFGIGVDGEYAEGKRAGFAFFYSNSSLDINNVRQESDLDAFNFIAYGSQPILDDKSRLFYQGGFGFQKNTSKRYLTSQTAKADYTSRSFYAQVKAVKYYNINDKLTITPAIEGSYRYFYTPSYTETGAGALNLNVQSSSTSQVLFGLLTKLEYKIDDNTHFMSNVALTYDFNNDASSVNASYQGGGAVFNTAGIKNSALSYELGVGIARKINNKLVLDIKYDLYGKGSDFINHAVLAKMKWSF